MINPPSKELMKNWPGIMSKADVFLPAGWLNLTDTLCRDLICLGPNFRVIQIKEKFGTLRFYAYGCSKDQLDLIKVAEEASGKICEYCSQPAELWQRNIWFITVCQTCVDADKESVWEKMPLNPFGDF